MPARFMSVFVILVGLAVSHEDPKPVLEEAFRNSDDRGLYGLLYYIIRQTGKLQDGFRELYGQLQKLGTGNDIEKGNDGNHALYRPAFQSSTGVWDGGPASASRANDGNRDSNYYHYSCSHTKGSNDKTAWWMVYLGRAVDVRRVVIQTRSDSGGSLNNAQILVGNSTSSMEQCKKLGSHKPGELLTITCDKVINGRIVKIQQQSSDALMLCEVEVYS